MVSVVPSLRARQWKKSERAGGGGAQWCWRAWPQRFQLSLAAVRGRDWADRLQQRALVGRRADRAPPHRLRPLSPAARRTLCSRPRPRPRPRVQRPRPRPPQPRGLAVIYSLMHVGPSRDRHGLPQWLPSFYHRPIPTPSYNTPLCHSRVRNFRQCPFLRLACRHGHPLRPVSIPLAPPRRGSCVELRSR